MRFQNFFSKIKLLINPSKEGSNINKNVKTYLLFLLFTAFLWFALQFSKNYSKEIKFNIVYTNTDANKPIESRSDQSVSLILEGNGFQLLKFYVFNKNLELDVKKATVKSTSEAYLTGNKMLNVFKEGLSYDGKITYSSKDTITIKYSKIISKQIPVHIVNSIKYATGYTSINGVETSLNKIKLTGPAIILDTLKFVRTEELKLAGLNKDYKGVVSLEGEDFLKQFKIQQKEIPVKIKVDQLTEGEFSVPIKILNVPKGQRVQLFPKEVTIIFGVALKDYPNLKAADFSVTVDVSKANKHSNTLVLKLKETSDLVFNARLAEKEVQYIVIK